MRNEATIKSMVCVNIDSPSPTDNLGVVALRGAFLGELIGVGIPDARRPPPVLVLPVSMGGGIFGALEEEDTNGPFFSTPKLLLLLLSAALNRFSKSSSCLEIRLFSTEESALNNLSSSISSSSLWGNSGVLSPLLPAREALEVDSNVGSSVAAGVLDLRERVDRGAATSSSCDSYK